MARRVQRLNRDPVSNLQRLAVRRCLGDGGTVAATEDLQFPKLLKLITLSPSSHQQKKQAAREGKGVIFLLSQCSLRHDPNDFFIDVRQPNPSPSRPTLHII